MQKSSGMLQPSDAQSGRSGCNAAAEFGVRREAKPCVRSLWESDSCKVDCQKTDSEAENRKVGPF